MKYISVREGKIFLNKGETNGQFIDFEDLEKIENWSRNL